MPALETLPPELQVAILQFCNSTGDLHCAIAASPRLLQVFTNNRKTILWPVLQRVIHPHALPHAVAAINVPNTRFLKCHPKRIEILSDFFVRYTEQDADVTAQPHRHTGCIQLAKLCRVVNRLTLAYVADTMPMLAACADPAMVDSTIHDEKDFLAELGSTAEADETERRRPEKHALLLSNTERGRLETALYRFEIHCKAFQTSVFGDFQISPPRQNNLFLHALTPWECEELLCLQQYFLGSLGYFLNQTAHRLTNEARANTTYDESISEPIIFNEDEPGLFEGLEMTPLRLHSAGARGLQPDTVRQVVMNGLEYIEEVLSPQTCPDSRTRLLRAQPGYYEIFGVDSALAFAYSDRSRDEPAMWHGTLSQDDPIMPNRFSFGYLGTGLLQSEAPLSSTRHGLRATGYVFWDDDRIENEDMLHGLQGTAQPAWNVTSFYRRYRELCMDACPENELRGAVITPIALKRLILKYGEVDGLDQTDTANHGDAIVCSSKEEEVTADDVCPRKFVYPVTGW